MRYHTNVRRHPHNIHPAQPTAGEYDGDRHRLHRYLWHTSHSVLQCLARAIARSEAQHRTHDHAIKEMTAQYDSFVKQVRSGIHVSTWMLICWFQAFLPAAPPVVAPVLT
jgi:hypothetical protein